MNTITRQQLQQAVEAGIAKAANCGPPVPDDIAAALRDVAATTTAIASNFRDDDNNTGCVLDQIPGRAPNAGYGTSDERAWSTQFVTGLDGFLSAVTTAVYNPFRERAVYKVTS